LAGQFLEQLRGPLRALGLQRLVKNRLQRFSQRITIPIAGPGLAGTVNFFYLHVHYGSIFHNAPDGAKEIKTHSFP